MEKTYYLPAEWHKQWNLFHRKYTLQSYRRPLSFHNHAVLW